MELNKLQVENDKVKIEKKEKESDFELADIFLPLLDKLWLIIMIGLICAIIAGTNALLSYVPTYTSDGSFYIMVKTSSETVDKDDLSTSSTISTDISYLMYSRSVLEDVIASLDMDIDYQTLKNKISVAPDRYTKVYATDVDPYQAKRIVDAVCETACEKIYDYMNIEKISIVDSGSLPTTPVPSGVANSTMMGGATGLVATAAIVIILSLLNDKIKTAEDIERFVNLNVLGVVPEFDEDADSQSKQNNKKVKLNSKKA